MSKRYEQLVNTDELMIPSADETISGKKDFTGTGTKHPKCNTPDGSDPRDVATVEFVLSNGGNGDGGWPMYDTSVKKLLSTNDKAPSNGYIIWTSVGNVGEAWIKVNNVSVVSVKQPLSARNIIPVAADDTITFANMLNGVVEFYKTKKEKSIIDAEVTLTPDSYSVSGMAPQSFNFRPVPRVVLNGEVLIEGTHYSVSYVDNADSITYGLKTERTAKVVIQGVGNMVGRIEKEFTIDIDVKYVLTSTNVAYSPTYATNPNFFVVSGMAPKSYNIRPVPVVKVGDVTLISGTDYTFSYSNNTGNVTEATETTKNAKMTVVGKGQYSGTVEMSFDIYIAVTPEIKDISDATVIMDSTAADVTGEIPVSFTRHPDPTVILDGYELIEGTDYDITYAAESSGTITEIKDEDKTLSLTITGKGNFSGTITRSYSFHIKTTKNVGTVPAADVPNQYVTGAAPQAFNFTTLVPTLMDGSKTLVKDTDFTLSYQDASGVITTETSETRTGKIIVAGKGGYSGTKTIEFNIIIEVTPEIKDISGATVEMTTSYNVSGDCPVDYSCKPVPTVTLDGVTLTKGVDYTVSYETEASGTISDIMKGNSTLEVTITGKGNYTGTKKKSYVIVFNVTKNLDAVTAGELAAKSVTGNVPVSYNFNTVLPVLTDGVKTMVKDTDYTVAYENVSGMISSPTTETRTGKVVVTGKGSYTGTKTLSFDINVNTTQQIADATLTYKDSYDVTGDVPVNYTCKPVPTVKIGDKTLVSGTDYTVSYEDEAAGTVTNIKNETVTRVLTITGKGKYTGTKTANYMINFATTKNLSGCTADAIADQNVTGVPPVSYNFNTILPVIKNGTTTLVKDTDYTLEYQDVSGTVSTDTTETRTGKIIVTGMGSYTGSKTITFNIKVNVRAALTLQYVREHMDEVNVGDVVTINPVDSTFDTTYWEIVDHNHVPTSKVEFSGDIWYPDYKYYGSQSTSAVEIDTSTMTPAEARATYGNVYCVSTKNVTLKMKNVLSYGDGVSGHSRGSQYSASGFSSWLNGDFSSKVLGDSNVAVIDKAIVTGMNQSDQGSATTNSLRVWLPSVSELGGGTSSSYGNIVFDKFYTDPAYGLDKWDLRKINSNVDYSLKTMANLRTKGPNNGIRWHNDEDGSLSQAASTSYTSANGIAACITLTPAGTPTYLGNVTGLEVTKTLNSTSGKYRGSVKWTDPSDSYDSSGRPTAEWYKSILVRKEGSEPTSETDGTVLVTTTTRNQYKDTAFADTTDLNDDSTYYYKVFPVSRTGLVTNSSENCKMIDTNPLHEPLTFTATDGNSTVVSMSALQHAPSVSLLYSKNDGEWNDFVVGETAVDLTTGDTLKIKAGTSGNKTFSGGASDYYNKFVAEGTGKLSLSGNIMMLTDASNPSTTIPDDYCFAHLFDGLVHLTDVSNLNLSATKMDGYCYSGMFIGCTGLTSLPSGFLPSDDLKFGCYNSMFKNCTGLSTIPENLLPESILASGCYTEMFSGCTGLTSLPENLLHGASTAESCYSAMFYGCTGLTSLPEKLFAKIKGVDRNSCYRMFRGCTGLTSLPSGGFLPATNMAYGKSCYEQMFYGCTGLTSIPADLLPATNLVESCYEGMFYGCTGLTSLPSGLLPATSMCKSCYEEMFSHCSKLATLPANLLPATTLEEYCYCSMFSSCSKLYISEGGSSGRVILSVPSGTTEGYDWSLAMFSGTAGTFKGAPSIGKSYRCYS